MTLHRRRKPYSKPYAARQLANVRQALAALRAQPKSTDWKVNASRAETFRSLEAAERKWERVLRPEPVEVYELPF